MRIWGRRYLEGWHHHMSLTPRGGVLAFWSLMGVVSPEQYLYFTHVLSIL